MRSEVQILPGPPVSEDSYQAQRLVKGKLHSHDTIRYLIPGRRIPGFRDGAVAQLGERLLCKQEVDGSIPFSSTMQAIGAQPGAKGWRRRVESRGLAGAEGKGSKVCSG